MDLIITSIEVISLVLSLVIVINIILRFILDPYNPLRSTLDSFVEPMLAPIRRILPPMGGFDFSPLVLIIIIRLGGEFLIFIIGQIGS